MDEKRTKKRNIMEIMKDWWESGSPLSEFIGGVIEILFYILAVVCFLYAIVALIMTGELLSTNHVLIQEVCIVLPFWILIIGFIGYAVIRGISYFVKWIEFQRIIPQTDQDLKAHCITDKERLILFLGAYSYTKVKGFSCFHFQIYQNDKLECLYEKLPYNSKLLVGKSFKEAYESYGTLIKCYRLKDKDFFEKTISHLQENIKENILNEEQEFIMEAGLNNTEIWIIVVFGVSAVFISVMAILLGAGFF